MGLRGQENGYSIADSAVEAFSFGNLLKRFFLFLVFGVVLGLRHLISNLDTVGRTGGGFFDYFFAISGSIWKGVILALGSMWSVVINPTGYINTHSYGSILFAVFSLAFLVMFFYQPISLIINLIDGQRGQATGMLLRIFVAGVFVLILSCIVFYAGGQDSLVTSLEDDFKTGNNGVVDNSTISGINQTGEINGTEHLKGSSIISLL